MQKNGKIVAIISKSQLVSTLTQTDVRIGDHVTLFKLGPELFDPETKNSLGRLQIPFQELKVTDVTPTYSILEKRTNSRHSSLSPLLSATSQAPSLSPEMPVNPSQILDSSPIDKIVEIGDVVRVRSVRVRN
jgi:hypothetical protein